VIKLAQPCLYEQKINELDRKVAIIETKVDGSMEDIKEIKDAMNSQRNFQLTTLVGVILTFIGVIFTLLKA